MSTVRRPASCRRSSRSCRAASRWWCHEAERDGPCRGAALAKRHDARGGDATAAAATSFRRFVVLRAVHGNRVESLLAALLGALPPADPFAPTTIVVGSHLVSRWLTRELAMARGIA